MSVGNRQRVQSLARGLKVMEFIAEQNHPVRLAELSSLLGIEKSSVHRIAKTLEDFGYLRQDRETSGYVLHDQVFALAARLQEKRPIPECARKYLHRLVQKTGETAHLAMLTPDGILHMEHEFGTHPIATTGNFGSSESLHCTAVGKALLSGKEPEEIEAMYASSRLRRFTARTITTLPRLLEECRKVSGKQIAFDNEEFAEGMRCVASPVKNFEGRVVAALAISGPSGRLAKTAMTKAGRIVKDCATELSRELGFHAG
jgi:DNA-binding IclR family transcriptional regulator